MPKPRDPFILTDAAVQARFALMLTAGLFLVFGFAGAGFVVTWFALFMIFAAGFSFFVMYQSAKNLRSRRVMPNDRSWENAMASLRVRVSNRSPFDILLCQVEDRFPPAGRERQLVGVSQPLFGQREYEIPMEFLCLGKRGRYTIGPLRLIVYDPLGFFTLSTNDEKQFAFYLYPPPFPVLDMSWFGQATDFSFGSFANPRLGSGTDFVSLREYRERDDTRHVHWTATARLGQLMVKEFEQTGAVQLSVLFDLSKTSRSGIGRHSTTEYAIKIAGSLARHGIEDGHQVQLLAQGEEFLYQPLASGQGHLAALMQELAEARPEGQIPLHRLIRDYIDLIPEQTNAVIIFSKCDIDIDDYLDSFRLLRARHVRITAVILDHTTFLPVFEGHKYKLARLAQQTLVNQGISVYWVRHGDDLAQALATRRTAVPAEGEASNAMKKQPTVKV